MIIKKKFKIKKKMDASIEILEDEIAHLKSVLLKKEEQLFLLKCNQRRDNTNLVSEDIVRFSRQMILPQIGNAGQLKLKEAKILLVGVGGLGCPILLYLVSAGVGNITIVDGDVVEVSNLHRQVLHADDTVGMTKVESAMKFLKRYNSYTKVTPVYERLTPDNSAKLVASHDIIIDGTDNVGSRYLLNDVCVKYDKPLVSGSALGLEGQVTVYNAYIENDIKGPCYRCLFPNPPPPESAGSCSQAGVLGPVPGLIGVVQSLEVLKLILDSPKLQSLAGRMILLDASDLSIRTLKLRKADKSCPCCGSNPKQFPYYSNMCGDTCEPLRLLEQESRMTAEQVQSELNKLVLLDVRSKGEFGLCHINGSVNFPISSLLDDKKKINQLVSSSKNNKVCFICRRGNDSQIAVTKLRDHLPEGTHVTDMIGGLHAWAKTVDTAFPVY